MLLPCAESSSGFSSHSGKPVSYSGLKAGVLGSLAPLSFSDRIPGPFPAAHSYVSNAGLFILPWNWPAHLPQVCPSWRVLPPDASLLLHASPECHLTHIGEAIPDTALSATPFPAFCPFFVLYRAVYHLTHKIFCFYLSLTHSHSYRIVSPTKSGPCPPAFLL